MTDPLTGYLRVRVACLFSNDGRVLAIDGFDPTKGERFWVPVGGRVEFGETTRTAIAREVQEELSTGIADIELLGVLENLFTFDGGAGHEIVFVYDGSFVDESLYRLVTVPGHEADGQEFTAHWIDPFDPGRPLYPDGLADLIRRQSHRPGGC